MSGFEILTLVATGAQALGQIRQGQAAQKAANYQAAQLEVNAGQARAGSQRQAIERKRQSTLLASRAQAIGASSGGGGLDPSTVNIISDIDAEGEYGALASLYQGEEAARGNIANANVTRFEGKQAKQAGMMNAIGTAGSFFMKYGSDVFGSGAQQAAAPVQYRDPYSRVYL